MQDVVVNWMLETNTKVPGNYFLLDVAYLSLYNFITRFVCNQKSETGVPHSNQDNLFAFWEEDIFVSNVYNIYIYTN